MWFGDVDLPSEIVDAHRRDSLVLFVGAGASIDSGLPSFRKLTQEIIRAARRDRELPQELIKHQSDDLVLGMLAEYITGRPGIGRSRTFTRWRPLPTARVRQPEQPTASAVVSTPSHSSPSASTWAPTTNPGKPNSAVAPSQR